MSPELLLKCAQKIGQLEAFGIGYIPVLDGDRVILKDTRPITEEVYGVAAPFLEWPSLVFDLENKSWQMDLQIALEKEGWEFKYWSGTEEFVAESPADEKPYLTAKTKPDLLAQCVESTTTAGR